MKIRHTLVLSFILYVLIYWSYNYYYYNSYSKALQHVPTDVILHPQHRQLASKMCFLGLPYKKNVDGIFKMPKLDDLLFTNETLALDEEHLKFAHKMYNREHNVEEYGATKYHPH